ncbi:cobyrinate a,c-diamide synthase [Tissierella pigra]|uniref:Cobyrinate a,c-diamide synthase n=1 Tax=Tissierella pigra TaxID=2607614 RepID=A0A6N7XY10_9FIRM|nr:cobyrinate a,c-diamide synthase [Tissierella pigra]MBU5425967.1 cobyrinate a,c-diamide synthase [Tissierella pigra]MSU00670.1 cobyrinate a,c-diamide synthase [Tissierella pigra]
MRTVMITAPSSNTGKTTITLGLIRAIKNRGFNISAFKTGPDFIDTKYLEQASNKKAGNLDIHLMGKDGIRNSLEMNLGDYGVVEGVMGYFDGIYNTYENSSFHISKELDIPAILVYKPEGEMFSAIPKIKGMVEFSDSRIKGIIFNKVDKNMFLLLKEKVEEYINIEVLGYLPKDTSLEIDSRYLGLKQVHENQQSEYLISKAAEALENTVNIDRILDLTNNIELEPYNYPEKRNITVALAYDKAFNFYYNENLKLLENICNIEYFSPMKDKKVPKADIIYIGGGYPELYKEELSSNVFMINDIRENAEKGIPIIAEAGGLMYLLTSIEDIPMCNIFSGNAIMTNRLQRFGYVNIELKEDTIIGKKGTTVTGNEYHRSQVDTDEQPVFHITKPMNNNRFWECGYTYKNVLGYYQHINFLGNINAFNYLLDMAENIRKEG